jgi:hypothetical protein
MAQLEELSLHAPVSQAVGRALLPTLDGSEFFIWSTLVELHKSWRSQQCGCNHAATVS